MSYELEYTDEDRADDRGDYRREQDENDRYERDQLQAARAKRAIVKYVSSAATVLDITEVVVSVVPRVQKPQAEVIGPLEARCLCGDSLFEVEGVVRCLWCCEEVLP